MRLPEESRLKVIQDLQIIGSVAQPEFDRLARLAGHVAHADYAHVCFIDDTQQFVKASSGLKLPQSLPRDQSICIDVVTSDAPLLIENLAEDARPVSRDVHRRYGLTSYVGVPIHWTDNSVVGAVAALSYEGGPMSPRRLAALRECADLVTRELVIRKAANVRRSAIPVLKQAAATPDLVRAMTRNHLAVLKSANDGVIVVRGDGLISFVNPAAEQLLGRPASALLGSTVASELHVSAQGTPLPEEAFPLLASLRDGHERLAKRAYFLGAGGTALAVEYAVSPMKFNAETIGAVVVFRRVVSSALANGVEMRDTLREVAKLKAQIARMEAALPEAILMAGRDLPDLVTGQPVEFADLLRAIREEQASQAVRAQALSGGQVDGLARANALPFKDGVVGRNPPDAGESQPKTPSRIGRWLATA